MKKGQQLHGWVRLLAFAILAVTFALLYKILGIYYAINDDTTMQKLAAGTITGVPDGHLVFIKYPIGLLISGLFKVFPEFDWYGIFQVSLLFLCFFLIAQRLISLIRKRKDWVMAGFLGVLPSLMILFDTVVLFQFTLTAGVLGATALFLLASGENEIKMPSYILVWVLLILTALVRTMVFYMIAPLAAMTVLGKVVCMIRANSSEDHIRESGFPWKKRLIRIIAVSVAGILAYSGITIIEKKAYSSERWKEYSAYKHARSLIMDYYDWPSYQGNQEFWNSIGFSEEEYDCLRMYGILPDVDTDKIVQIAEYAETNAARGRGVRESIENMLALLRTALNSSRCKAFHILTLLIFICLICKFFHSDKYTRLSMSAVFLIEMAELLYLLYRGRFPVRVIQIYEYQCVLLMTGLLLKDPAIHFSGKRIWIGAAAAITLSVLCVHTMNIIYEETEKYKTKLDIYKEQLSYINVNQDKVFILPPGTFNTAKQFTLHENKLDSGNAFGTYGWSVLSPWNDIRYKQYHLNRNDHILLYDNVFMLSTGMSYADKITKYYSSIDVISNGYEIVDSYTLSDGRILYTMQWN